MTGCAEPGTLVWFSKSNNPKRKLPYSWELSQYQEHLIGINSAKANAIVLESIDKVLEDIDFNNASVKPEVTIEFDDTPKSRLDILLSREDEKIYCEVKSVTLLGDDGIGYFPDTVSTRAHKHIQTLIKLRKMGHRALMIFCVQHTGIDRFSPAYHIDPKYADLFQKAIEAGVECLAYRCLISTKNIDLGPRIAVQMN